MSERISSRKRINSKHAEQWYKYGHEAEDDVARFMFFWISFNWLYNAHEYQRYRPEFFHPADYRGDPSERELILNCVDDLFERLKQYTPFSKEEFQVFDTRAVQDEKSGRVRKIDFELLHSDLEEERIRGMFLTLYQVRCNLFHGSKVLRSGRDDDLICSGAQILEGYLSTLFSDNKDNILAK